MLNVNHVSLPRRAHAKVGLAVKTCRCLGARSFRTRRERARADTARCIDHFRKSHFAMQAPLPAQLARLLVEQLYRRKEELVPACSRNYFVRCLPHAHERGEYRDRSFQLL